MGNHHVAESTNHHHQLDDLLSDPSMLILWASSDEPAMRHWAAINPNCPRLVLDQLAQDEDVAVRGGVVTNHNCSAAILVRLLSDPNATIRSSARRHPNCPFQMNHPVPNRPRIAA